MKINFKHVATAALAVAMSLSLASPALAEPVTTTESYGSLTVTGNELAGKNVFAVRMFTATVNKTTDSEGEEQTTSYARTDYELEDKWLPFFESLEGVTIPDEATEEKKKDAALAYVEGLVANSETEWAAFAEKAQDWLYKKSLYTVAEETVTITNDWQALAYVEKATKVDPVKPNEAPSGSAVFESLPSGYYIVFPEGGSTGNSGRATDAMLINIPTDKDGATWKIKSTFPTVNKKVDTDGGGADSTPAADNGSAQVGDIVTFTLTSKVPDMSDYTTFYFAFNDTLSNGLEFVKVAEEVADTDVTVTIGGKDVTDGYTVSLSGGKDLKIEFTDLKNDVIVTDGTVTPGAEIVVTYQAMITEDAVVGNPALNTVEVEYSNDPSKHTHGTSTPDESKVYTYKIDVNKWASDIVGEKAGNLAGAEFILSTSATAPTAEEIEDDYTTYKGLVKLNGSDKIYRVAEPGEKSVNSFTTVDSGDTTISGLKAGTYYLHEVAAPSGYNKLKKPITIVIAVRDYTTGAATITVNGTAVSGDSTVVDVENKKGIELPETGSIGTIGLTVAGAAIVLLGVFAPRKKKKSNQE